jgi:anti-sigma regulatory factor (Ser/Thr protein kinase)
MASSRGTRAPSIDVFTARSLIVSRPASSALWGARLRYDARRDALLKGASSPADSEHMEEGLFVEMRFNANPRLVSPMRRFVEEALEKVVNDLSLVSRVATAAHELLENASKYSRDSKATLCLSMTAGPERRLCLRLENTTGPEHADRLKQSVSEIDNCGDLMTYYLALMRRNARLAARGGLGLARIRVECEMQLALTIDQGRATITAETAVPAEAIS